MTRASPHPLPSTLRRLFVRYRRRWRLVNFQRGLFLTLGLVAAAVGLAIAADRMLRLEPTLRLIALVTIGVLAVASLGRWVAWPLVRRISDRDAAVRVGRHFPQMEEDLVSAVELSAQEDRTENGISRSLILSVLDRIAGRATGKVDHRAAVSLAPMLLAAAALVAVAAILAGAWLVRRPSIENALLRLFQPNRAVPYFSYTRVAVEPGDQVVRVGDAAKVEVALSGRPVESALLDARSGSSPLRVTLPCEEGRAEWQSGALFEDLNYRVLAGDAASDWYRVRVVPPPALRAKSAVLRDPDYAGGDERTVESIQGPLEIIDGTAVVLRGEPAARGEDAEFRCEGVLVGGGLQMALAADDAGMLVSRRFTPHASAEYSIALKDGFGLACRTPDSVFIKVTPDAVPQVAVKEPARDLMILPGERVEVAVEARDEFGLRNLALCQRKVKAGPGGAVGEPGPWERRVLADGGIRTKSLAAKAELDIVAMHLAPGDAIEYMAEASDYAGSELQRRGASRIYRVTLMSEAEHLEAVLNRLRDFQTELLRRAAEQKAEAIRAADLATKAEKATVSDAALEAKDREAALARSTEQLARKVESLIPEMARLESMPADVLSELERLGRGVSSVAAGPMAAASASLGQAAEAKAGEQSPAVRQAEQSEKEAADRLERLARAAERFQRMALLEKLAADAERLAARQRELKEAASVVAPKTVARSPETLEKPLKGALERLGDGEQAVKDGIENLADNIERAAGALGFSSPSDAETARDAGALLENDKTAEKAKDLAGLMERNVLFSTLPVHDQIASTLTEVAKTLRRKTDDSGDPMEAIAREIEEFKRRQREINDRTEDAIKQSVAATLATPQGDKQTALGRDVSEQAAALGWLAQEIEGFESATAGRLSGAADEMRAGAADLYATQFPPGLEHGKRALALLEEAGEALGGECGRMGEAAQNRKALAAMLLLQKLLLGQKKVNRNTAEADETRTRDAAAFNHTAADLAGRQSALRVDARRLQGMVAADPGTAGRVETAGTKMDAVRAALAGGDTGKDTRVVQRQVVALLESLMADQKNRMGGSKSLAAMRTMAMMQMLQQIGMSPGGYTGGTNAPILPATISKTGPEEWRKTHSRFEEHLGEGFQETYPAQFRDLLNSYFDRLRKEPMR